MRLTNRSAGSRNATPGGLGNAIGYSLSPLAALLLVATSWLTLERWADFDLYWHLANGRLMSQGIFPSPDRFSWSASGRHVGLNSVRFDQFVYVVWSWAGGWGLSVLSGALMIATLLPAALFFGRLRLKVWWEAAALLLLALCLLPYGGVRPHLAGAALLGFMGLLAERPFGPRKAVATAALLALWLNLHGSFLFGFAMLGIAAAAWTICRDLRSAIWAGAAMALAATSTALSPYGFELWTMPLRLTANKSLQMHNLDWSSLRPFVPGYLPFVFVLLLATAVGVWRTSDPRALAAIAFIAPAIQYARLSPLAAPLLMMAIASRVAERQPRVTMADSAWPNDRRSRRIVQLVAAALLLVGFGLANLFGVHELIEAARLQPPQAAVDQLLRCGATGNVWNEYNWGGYLIWRSNGSLLVGMDGRAETLYNATTLDRYFDWLDGKADWEAIIQSAPVNYALTQPSALARIDSLPGWRRVYVDATAVIAVRDGATWTCPVVASALAAV